MPRTFTDVAEILVEPARAQVHEEGWQSWSPTSVYRPVDTPVRGHAPAFWAINYKDPAGLHAGFAGEGLLAVDPGTGAPVRLWAGADPAREVPEVRAHLRGDRLVISADGPVEENRSTGSPQDALGSWAGRYGRGFGVTPQPAPTLWCSWYHYFTEVTEADSLENLDAMDRLELPVDVVQLDDGYQAELGDWLTLSDRFASLAGLAARIRDRGRRAGIWIAPFLVGARSEVARRNPEWLIREGADPARPVHAGHNWTQDLYGLDTTHPGAIAWLEEVFGTFRGMGFDLFKIDFVYAGALPGRRHADGLTAVEAYRQGLRQIRAAVGDAYLLGCGAPILPS